MGIDLHKTAFDDGTKVKLFLYEEYLKEWLPVFLKRHPPLYRTINIFDFFAGPGQDIDGEKGSPLITFDSLEDYCQDIVGNSLEVTLFFNDEVKKKVKKLDSLVKERGFDHQPYKVKTTSLDFQEAFEKFYPLMTKKNCANFLFLDQNGVKHITPEVFQKIITLPATDFLFFISSSTFNRFLDHPDIKKYHDLPQDIFAATQFQDIHRTVASYYRGLIPRNKKYYLAPFSIKKPPNIYGLIFGSGNIRGLDKFLSRCWAIDPQRGEANYDIDRDKIDLMRPSLFKEMNQPKKIQEFEKELTDKILRREVKTNREIFYFALTNGFLSKHARDVIKEMKENGLLPKQSLPISYHSCIKKGIEQAVIYHNEK